MSLSVPIISLEGSPYNRGTLHGRELKELIRDFTASVVEVHQHNNSYIQVDRDSLHAYCLRYTGFLEKFSPELMLEMRGIADGAEVPFEDILMLNSFLELEDLRAPGLGGRVLPDRLWGCTTFNVPGEITSTGKMYIGQTFDMEKFYEKYLVLFRLRTPEGTEALFISMAGILGLNGLNSHGIGTVINKVVSQDARPGVIYPFIIREALACARIGDALGKVIFTPRASGLNYQLCGDGVQFCAETSATRYQLLDCTKGLAHTNHYVGSEMRGFETPNWLSHGGSMVRKQVADDFLRTKQGELSPDLLKELTRNHTNSPRSICAHGFPEEGETTAFHTIFGVIMSPEEGWLELCQGNPCKNDYIRYEL